MTDPKSMEQQRIGQEIVYYIRHSASGVAVDVRDGTGLRDGVFAKRHTRYFYGDDALSKAHEYAQKKVDGRENERIQYQKRLTQEARR